MRQSFEKLLRPVRLKATMEEAYGEVNARRATAAIQLWRRRAVRWEELGTFAEMLGEEW